MGRSPRPAGEHVKPGAGQEWFWTPAWQAGEREADADLAAGRSETFSSGEEFMEALNKIATNADSARHRQSAQPRRLP